MSSRRLRALAVTAVLVAVAPVIAGCSESEGDTLRLGYFPNITHAPALVGVENGYFADALGEDVTLDTLTFNAGPSAIEALFSGAIDATFIGPNPAINGWAQSNGTALRIIAGTTSGGAALAVNPEIQDVEDLAGKVIATPQLANTQDVAARHWLTEQGYSIADDGTGDVEVRPTENAEVANAYASGAVDGAWLPEPHLSRLVLEQGAQILVDEADLWPGGQFVTTHLIVRSEFLEEHPDLVKGLLAGLLTSVDYVAEDPAGAQAAANAHLASLTGNALDTEVLAAAFDNLEFTVDPIAQSLQGSADHAEAVGLLDPVDLAGIYALEPLNELLTEAGKPTVDSGGLS